MLHDLLTFFAHTYAAKFGLVHGPPLHDPLAIAVLLGSLPVSSDPLPSALIPPSSSPHDRTPTSASPVASAISEIDKITFYDNDKERFTVTVVTDGSHGETERLTGELGRTKVVKVRSGEGGVRIPRGVDVEGFWAVLEGCVARAEEVGTVGTGGS